MDKIETKITEIENKLYEMRKEEEKSRKKEHNKKKAAAENKLRNDRLKNHWVMMAWLTNFIKKNKFNWERRRTLQERCRFEETADLSTDHTPRVQGEEPLGGRVGQAPQVQGEERLVNSGHESPSQAARGQGEDDTGELKGHRDLKSTWSEWRSCDERIEELKIKKRETRTRKEPWKREKERLACKEEEEQAKQEGGKEPVSLRDTEQGQPNLSMGQAPQVQGGEEERPVEDREQELLLDPVFHGGGYDENPEFDIELPGVNKLCLKCVMIPCVCVLTVLTGRLELIRGNKDKDRKSRKHDVPDRKEAKEQVPHEEVPDEDVPGEGTPPQQVKIVNKTEDLVNRKEEPLVKEEDAEVPNEEVPGEELLGEESPPQVKIINKLEALVTRKEEPQEMKTKKDQVLEGMQKPDDRKPRKQEEGTPNQGTGRGLRQEPENKSKYTTNNSSQEELGMIWKKLMMKKTSTEEGTVTRTRNKKKDDRKTPVRCDEALAGPWKGGTGG